MWNGENIDEVIAICPQVEIPPAGLSLKIPTGPNEVAIVHPGDFVMRGVGTERFTRLDSDSFNALYMPQ
jgi:hypothetical protein